MVLRKVVQEIGSVVMVSEIEIFDSGVVVETLKELLERLTKIQGDSKEIAQLLQCLELHLSVKAFRGFTVMKQI